MSIGNRAKKITKRLYTCYGTDSGCLFGLSPDQRYAAEAIVQFVLDDIFEEECMNNKEHENARS